MNVINTYYGRASTPLGAYKGPFGSGYGHFPTSQNKYAEDLISKYPNGGITSSADVPEAIDTYVKVLQSQPDNSVTIASIGFPINIRNLLNEEPELFERKVSAIYFMDGPYNFRCADGLLGDTTDCYGAAKEVVDKIPHTIKQYFQPNGHDMLTGSGFYNDTCSNSSNPVYTAYRDWLQKSVFGKGDKRPSWDLLTVYGAILGADEAQLFEEEGTNDVNERGKETWDDSTTDNNEYRLQFTDDDKKAQITEILE